MKRICSVCRSDFEVEPEDLEFYKKISPVFSGVTVSLPPPTLCPEDRHRRRLAFRNERALYHRLCGLTGKNIISIYSPDKPLVVYGSPEWWGDSWDAGDYQREYDPTRSFFEQFSELLRVTPLEALFITSSENSDYTNLAGNNKSCYMIFNSNANQDCMYSRGLTECASSVDLYFCARCELCYECINCQNCYQLSWGQNCRQCSDSAFLFNCIGCSHCTCCANLRHKQYCLFNRQLTKESYFAALAEFGNSRAAIHALRDNFERLVSQAVHPAAYNTETEDSIGDYLVQASHTKYSYEALGAENCKFCDSTKPCRDVYDAFGFAANSELLNEVVAVGLSYRTLFSFNCSDLQDASYCAFCRNGQHLFGCVGLKRKSYCILNKGYSKDDYETLALRIAADMQGRAEWGEFFAPHVSPLGYNESVAQDYYSLSKSAAKRLGFNWSDYEAPAPEVKKVLHPADLPQSIEQLDDDITSYAIECEASSRPFRITKQELAFYRLRRLPPPTRHPDQRHKDRLILRRPRKLWRHHCARCTNEILTSCDPKSGFTVYCDKCYAEASEVDPPRE